MDRFVTRSPRKSNKTSAASRQRGLKQVTIEELPRVVVVEDVERIKTILEVESQRPKTLLKALRELKNVKPSKEVLLSTRIGHKINALRKHEDEKVNELARQILKDWKQFYREKKQRPIIEVRSDAKTEMFRMKARKLFADSLGLTSTDPLPELMERLIFQEHKRRPDAFYRSKIRKLCLALRSKKDLKEKVLCGELSAEDVCKLS